MAFPLAADGTGVCQGGGGWAGEMMRIRFFGVGVGMVHEETFSPK